MPAASPAPSPTPLLDALTRSGAVLPELATRLAPQIAATPADEEAILLRGGVDSELIAKARATLLGVPYADIREQDIPTEQLGLLPRDVAESRRAVVFATEKKQAHVGLVDPQNYTDVQAVSFILEKQGFSAKIFLISLESFAAAARHYEQLGEEVEKALVAAQGKFGEGEEAGEGDATPQGTMEEVIKGAPVSRMVSVIMRAAVEQGASDIHIEPLGKETRVRYRVDGLLRTSLMLPSYIHSAVVSRIKVLSSLKLDETRIPQDGRITQNLGGKVIDFRVSVIPVVDNEKVVMRILDTSVGVPTLEQLGFRSEHRDIFAKEIKKPHGLILVSGPTGSGKSTSLYTILNMLNAEGSNIVTLEDPVEYYIKGVNQSQIRPEIGYTFATGLRSLLRQDPNVIMVGEIRDQETAELAVHAALTGHLIFSTIHTNDVFGVIPRLVDLHVEPFLIAATLNVAIAQRLARKICSNCKAKQDIPIAVSKMFTAELKGVSVDHYPSGVKPGGPYTYWYGKGCESCKNFGYQGRIAVAEIILVTRDLQQIIASGFKGSDLRAEAAKQGMVTLRQDAILKALSGETTVEEVLRISQE